MLLDLQEVHAQLCFRQKDVEAALGEVVERNPQWKLTTTDKQDFCEKMALRIRTMAINFRRAQAKEHPPKWLATVMVFAERGAVDAVGAERGEGEGGGGVGVFLL